MRGGSVCKKYRDARLTLTRPGWHVKSVFAKASKTMGDYRTNNTLEKMISVMYIADNRVLLSMPLLVLNVVSRNYI